MPNKATETLDPSLPLDSEPSPGAEAPVARQEMTAHPGPGVGRLPAAVSDPSNPMAVLTIMERLAKNKEVDPAKLGQVREFGQAVLNDYRRAAFDAAFAEMQVELPTITARGTIEIREKTNSGNRDGKGLQSTKYAKWEDINEAIKPILHRHGFGLRFVTGLADDGRVKVTGILSGHGHREESVFILPHDSTGSKNAVQAIGSSTSYGKRYAASALLNLTTRGEDDDGASAGEPIDDHGDPVPKINPDQIMQLHEVCEAVGCPRQRFLDHIKVKRFEDIPAADFANHLRVLRTYQPRA